ncbi:MAG: hypothetical protein JJT89_00955 [Nitriliruptoraceae bacterium]|nr:hypothetical protein [Nitriliruptoraceae bacterium]
MRHVERDPYADVDWSSTGRFKANLHAHTTCSDGSLSPAEVIDAYAARGYDVLAITDHDTYRNDSRTGAATWPWTDHGRDPDTLGMLAVRGIELTGDPAVANIPHVTSWFHDLWQPDHPFDERNEDLAWMLATLDERAAVSAWAHPTRSGELRTHGGDPGWFVERHHAHRNLRGFEVYSGTGRPSATDSSALYDAILTRLLQEGVEVPLWANAADDSHHAAEIGFDYHVHLLAERSTTAMRQSLEQGSYLVVQDPLGNALERHLDDREGFWTAAPAVTHIEVGDRSITIEGERYDRIDWIADGEVVHTADRLPLDLGGLGGYVRAVLHGDAGARMLTQPFLLGP